MVQEMTLDLVEVEMMREMTFAQDLVKVETEAWVKETVPSDVEEFAQFSFRQIKW